MKPEILCACMPTDTSTLMKMASGIPLPKITDLYVKSICENCECEIWIGPRQKALAGIYVCYECCCVILETQGQLTEAAILSLGGGLGSEGQEI